MYPVGIHYGYWAQNWVTDFLPLIAKAGQLGFDVLEIHAGAVTNMSRQERQVLKQAAADHDVRLTYCIGLTADMDPSSDEASTRRKGIKFLQDAAAAMEEMGGDCLSGILYGSWPAKLPMGADKRARTDLAVASVREAARSAEDHGVILNMEVVNRFEQFMMNTAAEGVEFINRVESPNCRLLLDVFHMNIEEDSFRESILTAGNKLGHFHLGETNRRPPGRGRMPWREVFDALGEIGYQGSVVMEPFVQPGGEVGRDISVYRDLTHGLNLDDEAARSVRFIRSL